MTQPDQLFPDIASNYGSFAAFAAKTQSEYEADIYGKTASPFQGILEGLFHDLPTGMPLPLAILTVLARRLLQLPGKVWDSLEDLLDEVPILGGIFETVDKIIAALDGIPWESGDPGAILAAIVGLIADAVSDIIQRLAGGDILVNVLNLFGQIPQHLFGVIPASAIGTQNPNLLSNPGFIGSASLDGGGIWTWDNTTGRNLPGSARTTADGTVRALLSNAVDVEPGQKVAPSVWVKSSGYVGTGTPVRLDIRTYLDGAEVATVNIAAIAGPGAMWTQLSAPYTIPEGVDQVRLRLVVEQTATGGDVWFDDATLTKSGDGPFSGILDLLDMDDLGDLFGPDVNNVWTRVITQIMNPLSVLSDNTARGNLQDTWDAAWQAATGTTETGKSLADYLASLKAVPPENILGIQGFDTLRDAFQKTLDALKSGLGLAPEDDVNLDAVKSAAEGVALKTDAALDLAQSINAVLNTRDNQPIARGISAISEPNFDFTTIPNAVGGLGAVDVANPSSVSVTATSAPMAFVRCRGGGTKGAVVWLGKGNADITAFHLNLYAVDLSNGNLTKFHTSENLKDQLDTDWRFESYTMPDEDRFTPEASAVIAVEWVLTGAGVHQVAGNAATWRATNHPYAIPPRLGAARNPTGNLSPASISGGAVGYVSQFAWFSLEETEIPGDTEGDIVRTFSDPGTYAFDFSLRHNFIDGVLLGGGGGGESSQVARGGYGGGAGQWETFTLERGVHFPADVTRIYVTVGAGGPGNVIWYVQGNPGSPTYVVYPDMGHQSTKIQAAGGVGGGRPGHTNFTATGLSPGSIIFRGDTYAGGAEALASAPGNAPGGGGGGSIYATVGPPGGDGRAWITAREL